MWRGRDARAAARQVDVDLALEGPAVRVSRQQARLVLRAPGRHTLTNTGRRALTVNNRRARATAWAACKPSPAPYVWLLTLGLILLETPAGMLTGSVRQERDALVCLASGPWRLSKFVGNVLMHASCMCSSCACVLHSMMAGLEPHSRTLPLARMSTSACLVKAWRRLLRCAAASVCAP